MIGVDIGARKVSLVDIDLMYSYHREVPQRERGDELKEIADALCNLQAEPEGWLKGPVWVEAPVVAGARNLQSTIKIAQTSGVVHALLPNTHEIAVASWKQRTVGKGNADKSAVRLWLQSTHPDIASLCGTNQDLVDAACIALAGRSIAEAVDASGLTAL